MGIVQDLDAIAIDYPSGKCKLCYIIKTISPDESSALDKAMRNKNVQHTVIAAVLIKNGYNVTETSVRRHRRNHYNQGTT